MKRRNTICSFESNHFDPSKAAQGDRQPPCDGEPHSAPLLSPRTRVGTLISRRCNRRSNHEGAVHPTLWFLRRRRHSDQGEGLLSTSILENYQTLSSSSSCNSSEECDHSSEGGHSSFDASELENEEDTYVDNTIETEEDRMYHKRRCVVQEIIATESAYVDHLQEMLDQYFQPMELALNNPAESTILQDLRKGGHVRASDLPSHDDVKQLFSNIVAIYDLNSQFLQKLLNLQEHIDRETDDEIQLGDAFLDVVCCFVALQALLILPTLMHF